MGGSEVKTMVPKVGIYDRSRGLTMNRGVFIEAPPDFFLRYGTEMETPKKPFDQRVDVKIRINDWKGRVVPQTEAEAKAAKDKVDATDAERVANEQAEAARVAAAAEKKPAGMGTEAGVRSKRRKG